MSRVPLYKGAEKKSYYKFLKNIDHVSDTEVKRIKSLKPNPSAAIKFADRAIVQTSSYTPAPNGVYLMDDGTLFISCVTPAPNITGEMVEWWMIWHQLDSLRYALWNPEDHYGVKISDEARQRILNSKIPIRERLWGINCEINESWNGGNPTTGELHFVSPESVGLKNNLVGTPKCQAIVVANNSTKIGPLDYPVLMFEYLRENDQGQNEWVVCSWMGHRIKNGKPFSQKLPKPILKKMISGMPSMFIVHSHKEITHLNEILPNLYTEQKDNWLE
ncbi:hypothetical protein D1831_14130, partial [Lactiplantibacillus garii]